MGVNLVVINGTTKLDLTADTVTAATLKKGYTAHNAAGDVITGTMESSGGTSEMTVDRQTTDGAETIIVTGTESVNMTIDRQTTDGAETVTVTAIELTNTNDATATAADIASGKTAYAKGSKLTGANTNNADTSADTVTADKLLSGYTAHDASGAAITGSMDSVGSQTITISDKTAQTITKGYHDGTGTAKISDTEAAKITASNIRSGVSILGVTGSLEAKIDTSDATATAAQILSGKTAYINDTKVTGTMTDNGAQTGTISTASGSVSINAGYHNGSGKVSISSTEQAKIIASNIKKGVSILGVTGTVQEGVDTSDATASASQILSGKTAYVNGSKLTGTCTYDADTSDATATAASLESGKTAYINGSKVTGTLSFRTLTTSTSEPTSSDGSVGDIWIITA